MLHVDDRSVRHCCCCCTVWYRAVVRFTLVFLIGQYDQSSFLIGCNHNKMSCECMLLPGSRMVCDGCHVGAAAVHRQPTHVNGTLKYAKPDDRNTRCTSILVQAVGTALVCIN